MSPLLPILALVVAASPPSPDLGGLVFDARSTIVTASDPSLAIYAVPPGVGYDGVAKLLITKPGGTFLCTGSLYGGASSHVVTAAHCLQDASSVDAVFFPPVGAPIIKTTASYTIKSGYTGSVIDPNDIAVLNLGSSVAGIGGYGLFTGDAVGQVYTQVGFGTSGTGATGVTLPSGIRRQGKNRFDFLDGSGVLVSDFDNGLAAQDALCFFGFCDLGLGDQEVGSAPGDSGGPLFIGGQIAAVASFGARLSVGDIDGTLNSSFGEVGGFVPIAAHSDWLTQQVVPEPAAFLLLFTGLLGIGLARRRQRKQGEYVA